MKYFYSIVIDGYSYHRVTEKRYKNCIDFYYDILPENFENHAETPYTDVWDYLDANDIYPTGDSYVAVDENDNELEDLETCQETFDKIMNKTGNIKDPYIYMKARSDEGDADWYGDFNYGSCPLSKYKTNSNLWESKVLEGSSHGFGCPGLVVKTTMAALEAMGWESDYEKYKTDKANWDIL